MKKQKINSQFDAKKENAMIRIKSLVKSPKEKREEKGISEDASKLLKRVKWGGTPAEIITQVLRNYAKDTSEKFPTKESLEKEVNANYSERLRIVPTPEEGESLFKSVAMKSKESSGQPIFFEVLDHNENPIPFHTRMKVEVVKGQPIKSEINYTICASAEKSIWSKSQNSSWKLRSGSEYVHFYSLQTAIGKERMVKDLMQYFEKLPQDEKTEIISEVLSSWRAQFTKYTRSEVLADDVLTFTGKEMTEVGEITEEIFLKLYKNKKIFDRTGYREKVKKTYLPSQQSAYFDTHDILFFAECLISMSKDEKFIDDEERYFKENSSEYATAFMEKKQINKEVRERMDNTLFKEYFNDVEFDNETDLEKLKQIEKEFIYLKKKFIVPSFGHKNLDKKCDFRIRKLGKHRANGIYFINQICLCIDPKGASSFVHEFFHFIDYNYNGEGTSLHEDRNFIKEVYRPYMRELDKHLDELTASRYNYLSSATEVFARMGEIYFASLPIITSLAKTREEMNGPEYPHELLTVAKKYFDKIIRIDETVEYEEQKKDALKKATTGTFPKKKRTVAVAARRASEPKFTAPKIEHSQLSLFSI